MSNESFDLKQLVADQITEALSNGVVPWHKPWSVTPPMNFVSKRPYRGVNVLLLGLQNYSSPYWMTFKQAQERGGSVREGEHHTKIVYWKMIPVDDRDNPGKKKTIPFLRYFRVFNAEQIDGIDFPEPAPFEAIEDADAIVDHFAEECPITYGGGRAYYSPPRDQIGLPAREAFDSPDRFYATAFHEIVHATGHKDRLARDGVMGLIEFGSDGYGKEELVAELGAAMLCVYLGIDVIQPSASYIKGWLEAIRADKNLIISAAGKADAAVDYILNRNKETEVNA